MVAPIVQAAAVTSGADLLKSVFGGRSSSMPYQREQAKQRSMWRKQFAFAQDQYRNQIQTRVADAKKAGIHPLYALGASSNISAPVFIPGQAPSGDQRQSGQGVLGSLAEGAGNIAGAYFRSKVKVDPLQQRLAQANVRQAEAQADLAELQVRQSLGKTMAQESNVIRPAETFGIGETHRGTPLSVRKIINQPLTSAPLKAEYIGDDGYRYRTFSKDLEELAQLDIGAQVFRRYVRDFLLGRPTPNRIRKSRPGARRDTWPGPKGYNKLITRKTREARKRQNRYIFGRGK